MFFKVQRLAVVLLILMGCAAPKITEYQDSYTVKPTPSQLGSISFAFEGKSVGVDNYAVYYGRTPLEDPLTAPPTDVTLNTYIIDDSLKLQINDLREGRIYYVWVYAKRGAEVIDSLPMQTVYPYTKINGYELVNDDGNAKATWLTVNGAKNYSLFKTEDTSSSLLAEHIAKEALLLENILGDQDSSYVVAYDDDGDILAESSTVVYDISVSLSLNAEAGVFPGSVKLRWTEDAGAVSYDIIYSEVNSYDTAIPSTEKTINIDPAADGILGSDPFDATIRTVSYLMENLSGARYVYQIKGKNAANLDSQFTGLLIAEPKQNLVLEPFTTVNSAIPYEMGITWNREYTTARDLNGKSLADLYSGLKYELVFTRPAAAPSVGGTSFVYSDTSNDLSYTNSTYSVAVNDSANLSVYMRNSFQAPSVGNYKAELKLVGTNKSTSQNVTLGSYSNTVVPNPIQSYALGSQFDGADEVTLNAPTTTSSLKNYYRLQEDNGYDDIPLLADLELLPATGKLDFSSASLASLKGKELIQYEVWTTLDGVYVSLGTGSTNTEPQVDLSLSAIPGKFPGSLYLSWNASYVRDTSGYAVELKKTSGTTWTNIENVLYSVNSVIIYDLDLVDETHGNVPINYDVRLTPNTETSDQSIVYSVFPRAKFILETPTQVSRAADYTPFEVRMSDKYVSTTGVETIKDIEDNDGVKFDSHFTGSLAPDVRLTITRPSLRPSSVTETFVEQFDFNYAVVNRAINDVRNVNYVSVRGGRAYAGAYSVKYQLVGQDRDGDEQILGESELLSNIEGGYLNPSYILESSQTGGDGLTISDDNNAKIRPRTFTKWANNGSNYQLIYFTTASGHSTVPTQPDNGTINGSKQIYKIGDGFPNSFNDLRRHEGGGGVYYIQVYTYRTSDDRLIGSRLMEFNSSFVLQPMLWYSSSFYAGGSPWIHWFMPYLRNQETGDTYYFKDTGGITVASGGYGTVALDWFTGFKIASGINDANGIITHAEEFVVPSDSQPFQAMVRFYRAYNGGSWVFGVAEKPYLYFYDPATNTRFGRGVGDTGIYGHYTSFDTSQPVGIDHVYWVHPG